VKFQLRCKLAHCSKEQCESRFTASMYTTIEQLNKILSPYEKLRLIPSSNWLQLCGIARFNACDSMRVSCLRRYVMTNYLSHKKSIHIVLKIQNVAVFASEFKNGLTLQSTYTCITQRDIVRRRCDVVVSCGSYNYKCKKLSSLKLRVRTTW